jgi:co-chaperonin GroES (HSP10)
MQLDPEVVKGFGEGPKVKTRIKGTIRPIHDGVLAYNMNFGERTTKGGIILTHDDGKERGIRPRWCQIYAIGPENKDPYEVGDWIYVEHGRWSRSIILEDEEQGELDIRLIDVNAILLTSKDAPEDLGIGHSTDLSQPTIDPSDFVRTP